VPRRALVAAAGVGLLAAIAWWVAVPGAVERAEPADIDVRWGGSEGHPSCVYDPKQQTVDATIIVEGTAPRREQVAVTVTAYADENTSESVGTSTQQVWVEGTVHKRLALRIPVTKPPHVDIDGETACKLSVGSR